MDIKVWGSSLRAAAALGAALPLGTLMAQGIYTCVDGQGRRLSADRPIAECLDREQRELGASGMVRRRLGPALSAEEVALNEQRERLAAEERVRAAEAKQRERALLARYPDRTAHERERARALLALHNGSNTGSALATQQEEHRRLVARFDQELARLQELWAQQAQEGAASARKL
jgi:hypothetical protein